MPDDWATPDVVQTFKAVDKSEPLNGSARSIPLDTSGDLALVGGVDGSAGIYSISQKKKVLELEVGNGSITDAIWVGGRAIFATSSGNVKIFESGVEVSSFNGHSGEVAALAVHPSKEILASVGADKSYIFYDLTSLTQATQVYTNSCKNFASIKNDRQLILAQALQAQSFIRTVTCLPLAALMGRSKCTTPSPARMLPILTCPAPYKTSNSRRMVLGSQRRAKRQRVFPFGTFVNQRRSSCSKWVARLNACSGIIQGSFWQSRVPADWRSNTIPSLQRNGQKY